MAKLSKVSYFDPARVADWVELPCAKIFPFIYDSETICVIVTNPAYEEVQEGDHRILVDLDNDDQGVHLELNPSEARAFLRELQRALREVKEMGSD